VSDRVAASGGASTVVHLSIHGATARAHDYHTGVEGSFAGLAETTRARTVVASTLLTRSSYRDLGGIATWLAAHRAKAWAIAVLRTEGPVAADFDRLTPRLSLAIPFALRAIDAARKLGIVAVLHDAPLCLLGPHAVRGRRTAPRAFPPPCDGCAARSACAGADARYLERFGDGELRPIALVPEIRADPIERTFGDAYASLAARTGTNSSQP
jgi:hypothetical protein